MNKMIKARLKTIINETVGKLLVIGLNDSSLLSQIKNNDEIMKYFYSECKKYGIETNIDKLFEYCRTFEEKVLCEQLTMF